MYAMDRAVHTEHSSESRRARRAGWRRRPSSPTAPQPESNLDETAAVNEPSDFAD